MDVEADKIYTDPKYVELISSELQNTEIDFITGNNSLEKFEPESGFHGFMPAGITVRSLKKICDLKKCPHGGCLQKISDLEIIEELCEKRLKYLHK